MKPQRGMRAAACCMACALTAGILAGCAGPSTRVLLREQVSERPYEMPEEIRILEEVNPFYLQESLHVLTRFTRESGTPGEGEAAEYIRGLLGDYGYETELQRFSMEEGESPVQGTNVIGIRKGPAPDSDILVIAANHDSAANSPGANNNASGVVTLLECARLLAQLSTDTELRFISSAGSEAQMTGAGYYVDSLSSEERQRMIGIIQLGPLGYVSDSQVVLETMDGQPVLVGDLLEKTSRDLIGVSAVWSYVRGDDGRHGVFMKDQIPSVMVSQAMEAYENQTPQDRTETVDVEKLASAVEVIAHMAADLMSGDTPSQLAKARSMNHLEAGTFLQQKELVFPYGEDYGQTKRQIGFDGKLISTNIDGAGVRVDNYQYRMEWFDVDQIILTDYHYSDGKLETISLDADGAGVTFEEMKERIQSWYGAPAGENEGPEGIEYDWTDPLYHKFVALIPVSGGFEVEIREYKPEKTLIGTYHSDGTPTEQGGPDIRAAKLLELIQKLISDGDQEMLGQISIYTDGVGDTRGYLEPFTAEDGEPGEKQTLAVDLEDAVIEDGAWRNLTDTVRLLMECYGQLLETSAGQKACTAAYTERFLSGDMPQETEPEFARDFMMFVLCLKPVQTEDASDERILFFYEYEDMVNIRTRIRNYLQLENEAAPELPAPDGGAREPQP